MFNLGPVPRATKLPIFLLGLQSLVAETNQKPDHSWPAILGVIVYCSHIVILGTVRRADLNMPKATITRCDLSPRFFCIDATLLCEFESDKIWINESE